VQFAGLFARKFVYFWWLPAQAGQLYPTGWLTAYEAYAIAMYAFATLGVIGILRQGNAEERNLLATLAAIGMAVALIHALAYVEGRHRWGVEPILLLVTARGILSSPGALRDFGVWSQSRLSRRHSAR
jgi:hypothetical protein